MKLTIEENAKKHLESKGKTTVTIDLLRTSGG